MDRSEEECLNILHAILGEDCILDDFMLLEDEGEYQKFCDEIFNELRTDLRRGILYYNQKGRV